MRRVRFKLPAGSVSQCRRHYIQSIRYDHLIQVRTLIKEAIEADKARVVCATCGVPVYLVSSCYKAFFFRHQSEEGSCPAVTRTGLSHDDIRAMKYKGAQESEAHRRLKGLIERSLIADSGFEDIKIEKTWRGAHDKAALKRPDV